MECKVDYKEYDKHWVMTIKSNRPILKRSVASIPFPKYTGDGYHSYWNDKDISYILVKIEVDTSKEIQPKPKHKE
tara:strand:+ start:418 stop:642 length:225 start_codon:yes stop_codon:yes gene_type:complete